jgi:K+-sensing histidine kinase KdpD
MRFAQRAAKLDMQLDEIAASALCENLEMLRLAPGIAHHFESVRHCRFERPIRNGVERRPGDGFGLPIARELAELYGGSLGLAASTLGGLKILLRLPAAR